MHLSNFDALPYTRHAVRDAALFGATRTAFESDSTGLVDVDTLTDRGQLHRLFEGAVVISEYDDELFDDLPIDFDD
jgi:hypothetical protein